MNYVIVTSNLLLNTKIKILISQMSQGGWWRPLAEGLSFTKVKIVLETTKSMCKAALNFGVFLCRV